MAKGTGCRSRISLKMGITTEELSTILLCLQIQVLELSKLINKSAELDLKHLKKFHQDA